MSRILRAILFAKDMPSLERALKWFLLAPQALLRQAKRGGQAGRNCVGVRFNSAMEGDWGALITLLQGDLVGEQERRRRLTARGVHPNRVEEKEKSRKTALSQLSKGQIGKCASCLVSPGGADITDPTVMAALKEKYPARHRGLPGSVTRGHCVDSLSCFGSHCSPSRLEYHPAPAVSVGSSSPAWQRSGRTRTRSCWSYLDCSI